jgi:hypothetical protein
MSCSTSCVIFRTSSRTSPRSGKIAHSAAAQTGDDVQAIAELQTLIDLMGPTPERLGLLGGRHKHLAKLETRSEEEQRQALDKAIGYYEQGMELDLNAYFARATCPSSIESARSLSTKNARRQC